MPKITSQDIVRQVAEAMHDPERVVKKPLCTYEGEERACVFGHVWKIASEAGLRDSSIEDHALSMVDEVAEEFTEGEIDRETAAARLDEIVAGF